jgi:hypothetical protein
MLAKLFAILGLLLLLTGPSLHAACSNVTTVGNWAYTYTGTIFTPNGPVPAAAVGHFYQDGTGNITGSQTRSVAGQSGVEDISGTVSVNGDCHGHCNYQRVRKWTAAANCCLSGNL